VGLEPFPHHPLLIFPTARAAAQGRRRYANSDGTQTHFFFFADRRLPRGPLPNGFPKIARFFF